MMSPAAAAVHPAQMTVMASATPWQQACVTALRQTADAFPY